MPTLEQDVLRLDVPVHDPLPVRMPQRVGHLIGDRYRVVDRELLLTAQPLAERLPLHVRHGVVEEPVLRLPRLAAVEERQDVRVRQVGRDLDLAQKALAPKRRGELGVQHLQRHRPPQLPVLRQVHHRHPPTPQLALEVVAVGQRRRQLVTEIRHGRNAPGGKRSP
jgi:hypothetical protein